MALRRRFRRAHAVRYDRDTYALGVVAAAATTIGVFGGEILHLLRRTRREEPETTTTTPELAREAAHVVVEGYRDVSDRENALLNLTASYSLTFAGVRIATSALRERDTYGPFRNLVLGQTHVHHFVPGIALAFLAGGASVVSRNEELDKWLAVPFGAGVALTLDESALLLALDDVYWTERGVISVQIGLAGLALLGAAGLGLRVLRRGERIVLEDDGTARAGSDGAAGAPAGPEI
jgi:hypothetical protein